MKHLNLIKVIFINVILVYFLLYILELFINFNNDKLFKKTRLYYLNKDSKKEFAKKIYLNFGSYKLLDKINDILPLSGYENSKILLCLDENNKPIYFNSDINGFNNEKGEDINTLLIGDSFVQGMCVNNTFNLNQQFRKFGLNTHQLAVGGNGPLLEFATFKEYKLDYNVENIFLFITPDNDFNDLSREKNNQILLNYLNNKNYIQDLSTKKNRERKIKILNEYFGSKTNRIWNDFFSVYHLNLKQVSNLIEIFFKKNKLENNYWYFQDKEIDELFIRILNQFIAETDKNSIKLYVIFNSVYPNILFPKTLDQKKFKTLVENKIVMIKSHLEEKKINFFDFNDYLSKNYNEKNISDIFKYSNNRWDHYSRQGYAILAKKAFALMN